ncbi:hypothetical protein MSAN_01309500 [Mycena sanguinolenta]|uniref:Uncharacterized protein n=1 Tax=Mycena sanguinolenta TaxID=230812 RepID=A0A8H6YDT0_9AGAR|nr:hypothetical protein MSAN_01309500 [Mycena sanguinolenta]
MSYAVDSTALEVGWNNIPASLSKTFTVLILYTIYVVLFLFSLYTILHRNSSGRRFMLAISSGMFILGTSGMILSVIFTVIEIVLIKTAVHIQSSETMGIDRILRVQNNVVAACDLRLITNNLLTDLLFLYRCYMVWNSRRNVLILPGICIITTSLLGYISIASEYFNTELPSIDSRIFLATSAATNIFLMCLTAGRIWYISQAARIVNQNAVRGRYHTVIAMILESGALYCGVLLVNAVALSFQWDTLSGLLFLGVADGFLDQMVNIIPTLLFVRVGMGYCQWRHESAPIEAGVRAMRTPKRKEEALLEAVGSEVIDIKQTGV